ncbi:tRNA pseudouridine synthase B [Frondihabitans sp. PAMC 28766]|uniref:tRNA pseudouridine(55) synthase TruB n=1 Tax=Frondihabitans sp. PAMC 28766 TaxID=1795630 RepID=UPI00078EBE45|nr:tRNA pseudouridine(55) synthase TruB [Frondihabitans sp. PAMC 28766]AMM21122.1 tRNA pseudouridine synthase B [Frondihabitans sp. PAMC 28766]
MVNSGILLVDKPQGITSYDVVSRVRKAAGTRKVGHAGTLDPMATGLLVVGINSSTRLLTFLVGLDKTYEATIRLGVVTSSDDADGEILSTTPVDTDIVTHGAIATGVTRLTGDIAQVPTTVSAIKVGGRRAYALAREGVEVELKARPVTVSRFDVLERRDEIVDASPVIDLDVVVDCTSGTYIRALARDLGADLGVGGHLTALRRTRIGPFDLADASELEALQTEPDAVGRALLDPAAVAQRLFPVWSMTADQTVDLSHGKRVTVAPGVVDSESPTAALTPDGRLAGLVTVRGGAARPIVNFPTNEVLS